MKESSGGLIGDRYEVISLLGRGTMGDVLLAQDTVLDRRVAIKVLRSGAASDSEALARFDREAKALARLSHPGVIRVFDQLRGPDGQLQLVLEYVDGRSLADEIEQEGPLPWSRCLEIGAQLADALAAAHAAGVIHRDLSPSNILLEADGRARIADFGIALLADSGDHGDRGGATGTPAFMAPEQARGEGASEASDLYSLAAIVVAAAGGTTLDPRASLTDLPATGRQTLLRALDEDPERRLSSARQMSDDLRATASPRRRRRSGITLAGAAAVVIAAGAFIIAANNGNDSPSAPDSPSTTPLSAVAAPSGADGYPSANEQKLLAQLTPEEAARCRRYPDGERDPGSIAGIQCDLGATDGISFFAAVLFPKPLTMRQTFARWRKENNLEKGSGSCERDDAKGVITEGEQAWRDRVAGLSGRRLCYSFEGKSILYWTVNQRRMMLYGAALDPNALRTFYSEGPWKS